MKNGIKYIGIMVANQRQRKRVLQTYQKATPKHIKIFTFTPSSINWDKKNILGLHYANKEFQTKLFPFPGVVYNRYYGAERKLLEHIEKIIGKNKCFNHVNHFDKQHTYDLLSKTELNRYLPETLAFDGVNFDDLFENYRVVYLKPTMGNRGKGVYRVEKKETGEIHISQHYFASSVICRDRGSFESKIKKLTHSKKYVVQQGISFMQINDKNFDIRVLVQKNRSGLWNVTSVLSRTAYSGCFNTSVCENVASSKKILEVLFPSSNVESLLQTFFDISLKTAKLIENNGKYNLGELCVDFGVDDNGEVWIIEINGDPQRTMFKGLKNYHAVYRNPIRYARFLLAKTE